MGQVNWSPTIDMAGLVYPVSTAFVLLFAFVSLNHARKSRDRLEFFTLSIIYGFLLEKAAIVFFQRYSYPVENYLIHISGIPIGIPLAWAIFIYAGYTAGRHIGFNERVLPIFVGLYVLHIDLAIDAVAIRVPFWTWTPPGLWFGVPVGNFFAWYSVGLLFTMFFLISRRRLHQPALAGLVTIIGSSLVLLVMLELWEIIEAFSLPAAIAALLSVVLGSILYLIRKGADPARYKQSFPVESFVSTIAFHCFYIGLIFYLGIIEDTPVLLIVSLIMLFSGVAVHLWPLSRNLLSLKEYIEEQRLNSKND